MLLAWMRMETMTEFLECVSTCAEKEFASIQSRREAGGMQEFEDLEFLSDRPFEWMDVASRAVGYELVAMIENKLRALA
jgi:hypothetical protein